MPGHSFVFLLLVLALPATAQITESIEVHLLEIEATVVDRGGKPVEGLTAADFDVKVEGKRVPVTNFYMVKRGAIVDERSAAAGPETAEVVQPEIIPTRLVLFVDDVHLHQRTKKRAVEALRTFVDKTMDDATTAMLVRWNGSLTIVVPATKDRAALLKAVDTMATEPGLMRNTDSQRRTLQQLGDSMDSDVLKQHIFHFAEGQMRETRQTLEALHEVTRAVSGLEGRRVLLHVSEGLPLMAGWEMLATIMPKDQIPLDVMRFNLTESYRALTKFAQQSGVVFIPFDPSGPDGATYAVDLPGGNPNPDIIRENHRNTAVLIARQTGGELIADTNELDLALARVTDQLTTYYSLGVPAPAKGKGPFDIKVSVRNRPELRVVTAPRRSVQSRAEMIASGVRSRLYLRDETNPLEAELRVGAPQRKGDRCVADVAVTVNASRLTLIPIDDAARGEVSFHFAVIDEKQQESDVRSTTTEIRPRAGAPVTQSVSLGLKARKYVVSTAFVDNVSGEASYLQHEIDATNCGK